MSKKTIFMASAGLLALSMSAAPSAVEAKKMEKCYGVVLAGKNDCAAADGSHSCAGFANADGDWKEWIALPEGVCERIVGGTIEPQNPEEG